MAGIVVEMSAREGQLRSAIAKLEKQQESLKRKLGETGKAGRRAGKDMGESFGQRAITQIASYTASVVGVVPAIQKIGQAWREADQARDMAAQKIRESEISLASLTQLAMGDKAKLADLLGGAKQIYMGGGARTLAEAGRTMFALESAGVGGERDLFTRLFGIVEQPDVMARAATTMLTAMGPEETGGLRAIMSKGFAASHFAPASAEQMLEATSRSGDVGRMLGMRDESLLAATSLLSQASGTAELGGTQLASYLSALVKEGGYEGMSLAESVRKIQGMGLSNADLVKFLGRKEAVRGYSTMALNLPELERRTGAITAAQKGDLLGELIASREAQPMLAATLLERQAKAREEVGSTEMGTKRILTDAMLADLMARQRAQGSSEAMIAFTKMGFKSQRFLYGDESIFEDFTTLRAQREPIINAAEAGTTLPEEGTGAQIERAAQNLERATSNMRGGPLLSPPLEDL